VILRTVDKPICQLSLQGLLTVRTEIQRREVCARDTWRKAQ